MDKKWLNFIITNFITLLRVVGIFALIPVYKKYGGFTTFLLSSLCFLTDFIDGFLARNLNASTFFGSLFDALSDKAFLVINLLLLMSISPYAIILIIFELTIALIQSIKYNIGMNIKSNILTNGVFYYGDIYNQSSLNNIYYDNNRRSEVSFVAILSIKDYLKAGVAIASSDFPIGPFIYHGNFRPLNYMSRDLTIFFLKIHSSSNI